MIPMHTRWVELGEGSLLIDLTLAARTIETAAGRGLPLTRAQRDALAAQREWVEEAGRGAELLNLKLERGDLFVGAHRGRPTKTDARRVATALYLVRTRWGQTRGRVDEEGSARWPNERARED